MGTTKVEQHFAGKTVLITGGAVGIGEATAAYFAERAARLVLLDRSGTVEEVASKLGDRHLGMVVDIQSEAEIVAASVCILNEVGAVDILVNNAGIGPLAPAQSYPAEEWDRTMSINLRGAFLCARTFAPTMIEQRWGRVINLASQAALVGLEGHVAYCASKAGILGMTRCMALEWGPMGITVNAVSPTVVETALGRMSWSGEVGVRARAAIPTRRFAQPEEVASAIGYLASEAAAMVNGSNLVIDGGATII